MEDKKIVAQSRAEVEKGVESLQQGNMDSASNHFWNALDCLGDIQDERMRRDELGPLALYFLNLGLYDLAIMASSEAITLDKKLGEPRQLAEDIVTHGNANMSLGNMDEAMKYYREALQLCLDNGDFDNAASASTNMATLFAEQGNYQESITLLRNSLDYVKKMPHPNTEKNTYLTLIQVLDLAKGDPNELLDAAKKLLEKYAHEIPQEHLNAITPHIDRAVQQYLKVNADVDPEKWKSEYLPQLYG